MNLKRFLSDSVGSLSEGFSTSEFESYVVDNYAFILGNLRSMSVSLKDLASNSDTSALAEVLGCDESVLSGANVVMLSKSVTFLLTDYVRDLNAGFSRFDFDNFFYANEQAIRNNLVELGLSVGSVKDIVAADVLESVLGVGSSVIPESDVALWALSLSDLLGSYRYDDSAKTKRIQRILKRVGDSAAVLLEGFSDREFDDFFYLHEDEIRRNLDDYGFTVDSVSTVNNPYDLASVLGCDVRVLENTDVQYYAGQLGSLLEGVGNLLDSNGEDLTQTIVDLLWVLRSSGVTYEYRKSMGVSDEEYVVYLRDLIESNGLGDLVNRVGDSVDDVMWDISMIDSLERDTDFDVLNYGDDFIDVIDRNGWDDERVVVKTAGKTYAEVVSDVLGESYLRDGVSPTSSLKDVVGEDFASSQEQDWSAEDYNVYFDDIVSGNSCPEFIIRAGATTDDGSIDESSVFLKDFMRNNGFSSVDELLDAYREAFNDLLLESSFSWT